MSEKEIIKKIGEQLRIHGDIQSKTDQHEDLWSFVQGIIDGLHIALNLMEEA